MKKVLIQTTILLLFLVGGVTPGFAHIISIEGETLYSIPKFAPDDEDFSFAYPFSVTRFVHDPTDADIYVGPEESQAVFAYLTRGDFDVYKDK